MSEDTDAPEGGAEGEVAPEAVETTPEPTTEQPTGAEEAGPADDAGEATEEPVKKVPWFQKRINEVTAKVYEKEAEAAYWRGIAEGRAPQQPQAPAQEAGPPDRWEDPEGHDQWLIEQAEKRVEKRLQQRTVLQTFEQREAAVRQAHPDFDSVVRDPSLPITPTMADVIRESDIGPQVAYHLGTNRSEAARIAALPPHRQAAELGRIEAALSTPPAASTKPIPPSPPRTVGAISSGLSKTMDEMSYAEFVKAREAEEANRN